MTVNYTTLLALGQPVTGTESGTWGDDVNNAVTSYLDIAIAGTLTLTGDGSVTLANTQGTNTATNIGNTTAQYAVLKIVGPLTATKVITAPSSSKSYIVINTDSTYAVTVKASGQTGVNVAANTRAVVAFNGTDYTVVATGSVSNLSGLGTGVATALGTNVGSAGAFVVNGGALGTPSSGTVTNLTGTASININGTVGATTPTTGAFTTLSASGVATFSAGTASAPAITTSGDTNNGIYFPAADNVAITTGGTQRLLVDSSGNVGIGTGSPGYQLNTSKAGGNGDAGQLVRFTNTSTGNSLGPFHVTIGTANYFASNPGPVLAGTNGIALAVGDGSDLAAQRKLTIDSSGNVGIGTSTPTAAGAGYTNLTVNGTTSGFVDVKNPTVTGRLQANASDFDLNVTGAYPLRLLTNNSERMRIDSSGNVGIGTSSPSNRLHVKQSADNSAAGLGARIERNSNDSILLIGYRDSTDTWQYNATYTSTGAFKPLTFHTSDAERMRIDTNGDVMMGVSSIGTRIRLIARGSSTSSGEYTFYAENSTPTLLGFIRNDGAFNTGVATNSPYNLTTGSAANVYVDSGGTLYRSTSSLRYKSNVQDATHGLADVLKLRSVTYNAKNSGDTVFGGLIAEEVHEAGLTEFVMYDKDGQPDALHYGNMVALLVKSIQEQQQQIDALKAEVAALKGE